jgi:hypothetical protein
LLKKSLFVVALGLCLSNAPAWASPDHGSADEKEKKASIRLKKPQHAESSLPSLRLMDGFLEIPKRTPPGLWKRDGLTHGHGRSTRAAKNGAVSAIPEPSALLFFGVGLVVARRSLGATWR